MKTKMLLKMLPIAALTIFAVGCGNSQNNNVNKNINVNDVKNVDSSKYLPRQLVNNEVKVAADSLFIVTNPMEDVSIQSVMILKNGKVIYQRWENGGDPETPHVMHSVSKTFCAAAIGMLIDEDKIRLSDKIRKFFPDQCPPEDEQSEKFMEMSIMDLLTMTCGHETEPDVRNSEQDWVTTFLHHPVKQAPGNWFCYNSVGTYMLSAIVQKVTGEKLVDFLTPRLFEPLNIDKPKWEESPQGINCGGWGLYLKTEDMAKFGQLYLQKGKWNGKQILSEYWIEESSSFQVESVPAGTRPDEVEAKGLTKENCSWLLGYGYQMWRCPENSYRADGARGQYIIVVPEKEAVIAITADTENLQRGLDNIFKYLYPVL
ncbi:MAG: beta-lactamase family protein [Bacteroidales bacterium]|nr:beta-lactamase family protein [Bacteroidales bacterium]